ncbi:MAG: metal ABC transporter permease [Ancalomicrobiaceae bacterium]|nr:metal ABC transporter permease [Ancalomicrobiaceae bacterium]
MIDIVYDWAVAPFLDFEFMRRALVGTLALALGSAPVGVFLMLRRMSLTGDSMAHAILPGAAIGYLVSGLSLTAMTIGGLVAGLAVAFGAGFVARTTVLKEDATLAAFYLLSLALGVTIVSLHGSNVDLLHVLFGTVLALDNDALTLLAGITTITLVTLALIFRPLVIECVDPQFLRSISRAGAPVHFAFMGLVVLNLVAGFHALGTLLAVGLMMLPAASARLWAIDLSGLIAVAVVIAVLSGYFGLIASYQFGLPSGPAIILAAGVAYAFSLVFGRVGGFLWRLIPQRHLEA